MHPTRRLGTLVLGCFFGVGVSAQSAAQLPAQLPAPLLRSAPLGDAGATVSIVLQLPAGHDETTWLPLVVLFPDGARDLDAAKAIVHEVGEVIAGGGCAVACAATNDVHAYPKVLEYLRLHLRIEQGGMHAAARGDSVPFAVEIVMQLRHEFQSLTVWGGAKAADVAAFAHLHARCVRVLGDAEPATLRTHFAALHAERHHDGAIGEVERTLDTFHDAASKGDEASYFAILPDDAVFLGTDATERWTGAEFRAFAMPYFQRDSAWIYVPLQRHVVLEPGDAVAWFDEVLDNAGYGECRGSGVLAKRDGHWVLRQYDLTVPVPNDLMPSVARRIRSFTDGVVDAHTTVIVVRHAEKADDGEDPELSAAGQQRAATLAKVLADVPLQAAYATKYRRTAATVAATCREHAITATVLPAADVRGLAKQLREQHQGQTVLVCGHSNTVPAILKALGVKQPAALTEADYDRMFVVTLDADGARLLSLRY